MTTQDMLIAAVIALWGAIGTLATVIHYLYKGRVTDRDATITQRDARITALETQLREESNKYDAREQAYLAELQERYETLKLAVVNTTKQNELLEAMNRERERERSERTPARRSS